MLVSLSCLWQREVPIAPPAPPPGAVLVFVTGREGEMKGAIPRPIDKPDKKHWSYCCWAFFFGKKNIRVCFARKAPKLTGLRLRKTRVM